VGLEDRAACSFVANGSCQSIYGSGTWERDMRTSEQIVTIQGDAPKSTTHPCLFGMIGRPARSGVTKDLVVFEEVQPTG
jgi:hypothetical protein